MVLWSTLNELIRVLNCVVIYGDFLLNVILESSKLKLHLAHVVRICVRRSIVLKPWAFAKLLFDSNKGLGTE